MGSLRTQKSSNFSYKRTLEDQLAENLRGSMCEWTGRAAAQDQACLGAPLASRLLWGHSAGGRNLGTPAGNPRRGGWVEGWKPPPSLSPLSTWLQMFARSSWKPLQRACAIFQPLEEWLGALIKFQGYMVTPSRSGHELWDVWDLFPLLLFYSLSPLFFSI